MGFLDNLYHLRAQRNMTQEQLAMLMGVSRQAISKWESGRAYPEMDKLVRLCDIFECDLNELVRGDLSDAPARQGIALPIDASPVDICGYDRHMRIRALLLASAPAAFMLSCAIAFGISPTVLPSQGSWGVVLVTQGLVTATGFGLPFLVAGLLLSLALATIAALQHFGFIGRYPYVADFYTEEQRRTTASLVKRACVVAILTGVIAVAACVVKSGPLFHLSGGLASLFAWGAVCVWSLIYAALMQRRLNVEAYNNCNASAFEQREAARVVAELPATRMQVATNPDVPRLAQVWVKRQAMAAALSVFAGFAVLAAVFALLGWVIWFIPLMVGAVAAALFWIYLPTAR